MLSRQALGATEVAPIAEALEGKVARCVERREGCGEWRSRGCSWMGAVVGAVAVVSG